MNYVESMQKILNNDLIFVYFLSFIILIILIYDLLCRINFFQSKNVNIIISLIISFYVFLTNGYRIINLILSISTIGLVLIFGLLILAIIIFNFWTGVKKNKKFS